MVTSSKTLSWSEDKVINQIVPFAGKVLSDPKAGITAISNAIQESQKIGFIKSCMKEWSKLVEEGKAKSEYFDTEQWEESISEFFDILDKEKMDKEKLKTLKKIFAKAMISSPSEWANRRPQQMLGVARDLCGDEVVILMTAYKFYKTKPPAEVERDSSAADQWPKTVAKFSNGLLSEGVVDKYEDHLVERKLIGVRTHTDRSGVRFANYCRLTILGREFCEFLDEIGGPGGI